MDQLNKNKLNIKCEWMEANRILINPDGQVLPCCFLANTIYMYDKTNISESKYLLDKDEPVEKRVERRNSFENQISKQIGDKDIINNETKQDNVLMDYYVNKSKYNIFENSLEDIINSEWFTKTLPESWDDESKVTRQCKKYCTRKKPD